MPVFRFGNGLDSDPSHGQSENRLNFVPGSRHIFQMYQIDLRLHCLPRSTNKSLRAHWTVQRREGKQFDKMIAELCIGRLPEKPLPKARIRIVRHFWRTLDYDGLVGSMKPVVDALVSAGMLESDSWKVLGQWDVSQEFRPRKLGPLIEIHVCSI